MPARSAIALHLVRQEPCATATVTLTANSASTRTHLGFRTETVYFMKHYFSFIPLYSAFMIFFVLAAQAFPADSAAASETPAEVAARLQDYYRQIDSLSFSFVQATEGQMIGRPKTGRGNGVFARTASGPKMRWNYNLPDHQVLISDGDTISMYFEELNQMIIAPVNRGQADILFSFFAGQGSLETSFTILESNPEQTGGSAVPSTELSALHLVPKNSDSQLAIIHLYLTPDALIRRVELVDHFETRTTITIADISVNPFQSQTPEEIQQLFVFTPPHGTEIIRQ